MKDRQHFAPTLRNALALSLSLLTAMGCTSADPGDDGGAGAQTTQTKEQDLTVVGFADLHLHMFAEDAFGGRWLHGEALGPQHDHCDAGGDHARVLGVLAEADPLLRDILGVTPTAVAKTLFSSDHVDGFAGNFLSIIPGTEGDTGEHIDRRTFPAGWPRWDTIAHQQAHVSQLKAAHDSGLNLVVMSAVSYDWLCELLPPENGVATCDEMADVYAQLQKANQLAAQESWVEIALSADHARAIINRGNLAMILAVEASHIFSREGDWRVEFQNVYDLGVRSVQPVHEVDNRFGGAALHHEIFQIAQYLDERPIEPGGGVPAGYRRMDYDCGVTTPTRTLGFDVYKNAKGECRNARGLTSEGVALINELIDRQMLIDVAHVSERTFDDIEALAQARGGYPLYNSHIHIREMHSPGYAKKELSTPVDQILRIRDSGGLVGIRTGPEDTRAYAGSDVSNSCQGSSRSFAQVLDYAEVGLDVPVAFGTDLNGFIQQTRPRYGDDACGATRMKYDPGAVEFLKNQLGTFLGDVGSLGLDAIKLSKFDAQADCEAMVERKINGQKLGSDFDTRGLAHIGLLGDMLQDLRNLGARTAGLESSAENTVAMWERAQGSGSPAGPFSTNTSGVGGYKDIGDRARDDYPQNTMGKAYCPGHQLEGGDCYKDAECSSGKCKGEWGFFGGITKGKCVCDGSNCGERVCGDGEQEVCDLPASEYDNANCQLITPTTPFHWGGNLYYGDINGSCPVPGTWFDGANCYIGRLPSDRNFFVWEGKYYYQPACDCQDGLERVCEGAATYDGANCKVPTAGTPFQYDGLDYYEPSGRCEYGTFDGANCYYGAPPPGSDAFYWEGRAYYEPQHICPDLGSYDGANCHIGSPPPRSKGAFMSNGHLYYQPPVTCNRGGYDSANCYIGKAPAPTFSWGGNLYYEASHSSQCIDGTDWDGANCLVGYGWEKPFTYNGGLYVAPVKTKNCPIPGTWYDGANCFAAHSSLGPFIYEGHMYVGAKKGKECPVPHSEYDGSNCRLIPNPGTSTFVWNGKLYSEPIMDVCSAPESSFDTRNCRVHSTPRDSWLWNGNLYFPSACRAPALGNTNIALGASVSVPSTFPGYSASKIVDGDTNTTVGGAASWTNGHTYTANGRLPQTVKINWKFERPFNRIAFSTSKNYELDEYAIEAWVDGAWQSIVHVTGNKAAYQLHDNFGTVRSSRIRVVAVRGPKHQPQYARINEVQVFGD